jgi:hypothetical protein
MTKEMWTVTFVLDRPSPLEVYSEIGGMMVEVKENNSQVVISVVQAASIDEVLQKASSAANQLLNELSWRFSAHLAIKDESYNVEHVAPSGEKQVFVHPEPASVVLSEKVIVVKKDASGNTIEVLDSRKPGKIHVKPSEAKPYYRKAHLTNDPFDSFRNLYLASENVADKIRINKGYGNKHDLKKIYGLESSEENSLRLALDERFANNPNPLIQAAKHIHTFDDRQLVVPQVSRILYKANRCQLNHAKASEDKKVPFNPQDEEEVKAVLPLMDFVAKSLLEYEQTSLLK